MAGLILWMQGKDTREITVTSDFALSRWVEELKRKDQMFIVFPMNLSVPKGKSEM